MSKPTGGSPCSSAASPCSIRSSISAAAASVNVIATTPRSTRSAIRAGSATGSPASARSQPGPRHHASTRATRIAVFPVPAPAWIATGRANSVCAS
jgi:hypothetical protein